MAATDPDHVSTGSGVNNAVARTASLAGLAVIPVIAALPAATGAAEVTDAVRTALVIAAALAVTAGVVMSIGLAPHVRSAAYRPPRPLRRRGATPPARPSALPTPADVIRLLVTGRCLEVAVDVQRCPRLSWLTSLMDGTDLESWPAQQAS